MVSDADVERYSQAIEEVLANAPGFDEMLQEVSAVLKAFGLPEDPTTLIGRKVAVMCAGGETGDLDKAVSSAVPGYFIEHVPDMGWNLRITEVKDVRYHGGNQNPSFDGIIIETEEITFSLDPEKPGEWNQDWYPERGKYKFL